MGGRAKKDMENTMVSSIAGVAAGKRQGVVGKEASSCVPCEGA